MNWIYLVIIMISITAGFYIWQNATSGGLMPTDPQAYADAWEGYGEEVFAEEGQPWRMVGFFFFPLLIYFSMYYFAFSVALVGLQSKFPYVYGNIQRPVVVLSFAVAFIMLPFPFTYSIYGFIGGLSPILLVFVWIIPIIGIAVAFSALRGLGLGGGPGAAAAPLAAQLPAVPPTPAGAPPALPPAVVAALQATAQHLNQAAQRLANIR